MRISLVTTCRNEIASFRKWKDDVLNQVRKPDEICIVDSISSDGTQLLLSQWAEEDDRVKILELHCNPAKGRNKAVAISTGDIIVSTDLGCRLDKYWLEKITEPFDFDDDIDVVVGNYKIDFESIKSLIAKSAYYLESNQIQFQPGFLPSNRSVAYRKSAWFQLGGLPEDLSFCGDDTVLAIILNNSGLKIYYSESAIVYWTRHNNWNDYLKEKYRYGFGNGEAKILLHKVVRLVENGWPKLIILLSVGKDLGKIPIKPIIRATRDGNLLAAALIFPYKIIGKYYYLSGMADGIIYGREHCMDCRNRISNALRRLI